MLIPTQSSNTSSQQWFSKDSMTPHPGRVAGSGARPGEGRGRNDFHLVGPHGRLRPLYAPWNPWMDVVLDGDGGCCVCWSQGFCLAIMGIYGVLESILKISHERKSYCNSGK